MAEHSPVKPTPDEIRRADHVWTGFVQIGKYSIAVAVATLALLGLIFIDW